MLRRSRRWLESGGGNAVRALVALTALGCCLAAAAYAATGPLGADRAGASHLPKPRLTGHPDPVTAETSAEFEFSRRQAARGARRSRPGFECRLDGGAWDRCQSPLRLDGLRPGRHRFGVRIGIGGRHGGAVTFGWRITAPSPGPAPAAQPAPPPPAQAPAEAGQSTGAPFSIELLAPPEPLAPGAPAQSLAVRLSNPGSDPIAVTALGVSLAADPPGCPAGENFSFIPSTASPLTPVSIAAEASVTLPAQGVQPPAIAMRDLPVSQDACQGARLELVFNGEAQG